MLNNEKEPVLFTGSFLYEYYFTLNIKRSGCLWFIERLIFCGSEYIFFSNDIL